MTLGAIWLLSAICDRIWFALDHSVPAWDQADYLTGSLNYWQALQQPQWLSGEWWRDFWQLSSKIPPGVYIATAIIQNIFGTGLDQATLVLLLSSGILIVSVYVLGITLFDSRVGLWAAGLIILLPGLYRYRLEFLLDYPLTAAVSLSFCCLTLWRYLKGWCWALVFGISLGLALMVKQTALLFLLIPVLWVIGGTIRRRNWVKFAQLMTGLLVSVLVFGPWYRINWLLILTSGKRATIDSAIAEGEPALNTLEAWIYYWKILPYLISWPLLLVPIVGLLLYWKKQRRQGEREMGRWGDESSALCSMPPIFPIVFLVGGYLLCSLNINKDARYILPLLPVLSLFLAYGLNCWCSRWAKRVRWGTIGLAIILMLLNLFPLGGAGLTKILSPRVQHLPYLREQWLHQQVIEEIIKTSPYLRTTLGVLPSTPQINQHNLNYYGALENFQVYGRQVGTQEKQILQDVGSLSWFLTKDGDQGSVPAAQTAIVNIIEQSPDFQLHQSWNLPDASTLQLYHRLKPPVEVIPIPEDSKQKAANERKYSNENSITTKYKPLKEAESLNPCSLWLPENRQQLSIKKTSALCPEHPAFQVKLETVTLPATAPPGVPVPVSYEWIGSWEQLQSGIVLLNWQSINGTLQQGWFHDHGIGMGELHPGKQSPIPNSQFRVIETTAMLPSADLPAGNYRLEAIYLNRQTGKTYPIPVPNITLNLDPAAKTIPAPELDLITQLRTLSTNLPQGTKALESVFEETGRINQYDPIQDYLVQVDLALQYRLQLQPDNLDFAYTRAFAKVLQEDVEGAIAAWKRVVLLDSQNPYAYAYLAFVYLYNWQAGKAQEVLNTAIALNPNIPEIQALSGIAALWQGNLVKAWQVFWQLEL
ncbi:MAG: phospholipid carrier-dependent glycosyltransferase [Symploca sp. SIO2B6]|nr:phospholipid carrier-dependent glycosyltransferase [Symploca sp. SIO2B6]